MATRPPLSPPVNETEHSVSRITREGKRITYKLNVMQQPERARACGAGAKCTHHSLHAMRILLETRLTMFDCF